MKVSIITISKNSENEIEETINSVIKQDYPHIEYIIIDGNSEDKTLDIVGKYKHSINTILSEPDTGIYNAMNKGLSLATGDIIGFINAGDRLFSEEIIGNIVQKFQLSNVDVVYGDKMYVEPRNDQVVRIWKAGEYDRKQFEKGWMPPHQSTYIRSECYESWGHFREDFRIAADYELLFRFLYVKRATATYLPHFVAKMKAGGLSNSSIKNILISNYEVYKSWKLNGVKISPLIILKKPLRKIKQKIKIN